MEARWRRSARRGLQGQMGVAAIDLRTGETIAVNADIRFPTASTIKTAVMVEAWQQVPTAGCRWTRRSRSKKPQGRRIRRAARAARWLAADHRRSRSDLMIVLSDNTATNMLIGRLGTAQVNERLDAYGLKEHETLSTDVP